MMRFDKRPANDDDRIITNEERRNAGLPTAYSYSMLVSEEERARQIARGERACRPVTVKQLRNSLALQRAIGKIQ